MTDPRSSLAAHMRPLLNAAYGAPTDPATQSLHEAAVTNMLDWLRAYLGQEEVVERAAKAYCAAYCAQLRRWNPAGFPAPCTQCDEWPNVIELSKASLSSILESTP